MSQYLQRHGTRIEIGTEDDLAELDRILEERRYKEHQKQQQEKQWRYAQSINSAQLGGRQGMAGSFQYNNQNHLLPGASAMHNPAQQQQQNYHLGGQGGPSSPELGSHP